MRNARILTIVFILMMVFMTAGSFGYLNFLARQAVEDSVRGNLESSAIVIASGVDGDSFAKIQPGDESTPSFIALRDSLHRVEKADPAFQYVYTMRKNGGNVEFVVDGDYGISPDAAKIGDVYRTPSPEMLNGFITPSAELQFSTDQWGTALSGYAPIRDSEGKVVGIVGVDEDSRDVAQEMGRIKTVNYAFLSIIIAIFALGAIIFDFRRSRVEEITQNANKKLNQLNGIIRHDIFNTLTGLSGYVEMAQESETLEETRDKLKTIEKLADKIQQQIALTRDYQDLGLNMPRWQDVSEVVAKAASSVNHDDLIIDIDFAGLEIYADSLLDRAFLHLLEDSVAHGQRVTRINGYYPEVWLWCHNYF